MKRTRTIFRILLICLPFCSIFGQNAVMFKKIIEPVEHAGVQNLRSKDALQKVFFPDNNGLIEFFEAPSFRAEYGFRMVHTTDDQYTIEIKQIANWKEIKDRLDSEYPLQIPSKDLPKEKRDEMNRIYTKNVTERRQKEKEVISEYKIESTNVNISKSFADELYNAFAHLIKNYKSKGENYVIQPDGSKMLVSTVTFDGSQMTLRCVVDNEIWSFFIGKSFDEMDKLTKLCNGIIVEALNENQLDEDKYIQLLEKLVEKLPHAHDEKYYQD